MKNIIYIVTLSVLISGIIIGLGIAVYRYESKKNNNVNKAIYYYEEKKKTKKLFEI